MNELKAIHKTIIACLFLTAVVILQIFNKQTESFITVGLLVLTGIGFAIGKIEAVQKQSNGSQEKLIAVIEESNRRQAEMLKLIASLPPAPIVIEGTTTTTTTTVTEGTDHGNKSLVQTS